MTFFSLSGIQLLDISTDQINKFGSFSDVDNMDDKSAVKLDGKTFLKFTNKINKM